MSRTCRTCTITPCAPVAQCDTKVSVARAPAGLPPVTAEWFEARKGQLESLQSRKQADAAQVYVCPLTGKKFQSGGTYASHTRTRKFRDAMKKAGLTEAPAAKIATKSSASASEASGGGGAPAQQQLSAQQNAQRRESASATFARSVAVMSDGMGKLAVADESASDSDWETASDASDEVRTFVIAAFISFPFLCCRPEVTSRQRKYARLSV